MEARMETGTHTLAVGSTIKLIREEDGWRVQVLHGGHGGITGRMKPFNSLDEALVYIKERYTEA
jgi:hypothetical protein